MKIVRLILKIIWNLFLAYSVIFTVAFTVGLIYVGAAIYKPVKQVKLLATTNPTQTSFMSQYALAKKIKAQPTNLIRVFIPIDSISPYLIKAVLAAEDDGFYTHPGFDIEAMLAAMQYNRTRNSIKRGASTITQQLAKNIFLNSSRTFERKFMEMLYTILMEHYLGKDRILELYLNYAQWGPNIFGCEAASLEFFNKSSKKLTQYESARMAAVLAMPEKLSPKNAKSAYMGKRLAMIANNLYLHGSIKDSAYTLITNLPPPKDSITDSLPIEE